MKLLNELEENKIANAQLKNIKQFANHTQLRERKRWIDVETPVGRIKSLLPPAANSKEDIKVSPIPEIGEHTNQILTELGMDQDTNKTIKRHLKLYKKG